MAYQQDSGGPHADKGLFIAKIIASVVVVVLIVFISKVAWGMIFTESDEQDLDRLMIETELLKETTNYHIKKLDSGFEVSLWDSGWTSISKNAFMGDEDAQEKWDSKKEHMQYLASVLSDRSKYDVVVKFVNEDNHARALLSYTNGRPMYDVVLDTKKE